VTDGDEVPGMSVDFDAGGDQQLRGDTDRF
jgi:hypothetical protein